MVNEHANEVVLIDLSSIAHPIWHTSQAEPDPNATSQRIIARVRALAGDRPHVAICCDSGRSFRHDISASYKGNRPEHEATLHHQITLARERLAADGFPIWAVPSFEADDLIATAVARATEVGLPALIVSADKDLLQLVGPTVRAMSVRDGGIVDAEAVKVKFGVTPGQMRDYLTLVGDASDNIKGAAGIGPKKAADLLAKFNSIEGIYEALTLHGTKFTPALATALREFQPRLVEVRALVTLRTDADLPFAEISGDRIAKDVETAALNFDPEGEHEMDDETPAEAQAPTQGTLTEAVAAGGQPQPSNAAEPSTAVAIRDTVILPAPKEWERGLDPRSMKDARILAKDMFESRMFSAYGTPQGVLATVMVGRELGLPALASLRCIHVIEGKHGLSAQLMVALILRSGFAEYFEPISFSDTEATYETHRKGARNPIRLTHTIDMARKAWTKTPDAWDKSGWGRVPTDMLVARATARLARMIYPDLLAGMYTPEELEEVRQALAA